MKKMNFTKLLMLAGLMLGLFGINSVQAQLVDCAGGTETITANTGNAVFNTEINWELQEAGAGIVVYEAFNGGVTENMDVDVDVPTGNYDVYGYDTFGDNWNGFTLGFSRGAQILMPPVGSVAGPGNGNGNASACGGTQVNGTLIGSFAVQPLICTITCPADVTVSTDPGVCEADVTVPDPTVDPSCLGLCSNDLTMSTPPTLYQYNFTGLVNTTTTLTGAQMAACGVTMIADYDGDHSSPVEAFVIQYPDGTNSGNLNNPGTGFPDCQDATRSTTIPIATWNNWVTTFGPNLTFTLLTDPDVDSFCGGAEFTLTFEMGTATVPFVNNQNGNANASGTYGLGTTVVTYTTQDATGADVSCSFNVTVVDMEGPTFNPCFTDVEFNLLPGECDIVYNYVIDVTDNCPAASFIATQSLDTMIVTDAVACGAGPSSYLRRFDALVSGPSRLTGARFGVWAGNFNVRVRVFEVTGAPFAYANMNLLGQEDFAVPAGNQFIHGINFTTPIDLPIGADIVFDARPTNGPTFTLGINSNGETADTYIASDVCNTGNGVNPATMASIGFPTFHWPLVLDIQGADISAVQTDGSGLTSGDAFPVGCTIQRWEATDAALIPNVTICEWEVCVNEYPFPTLTLACNDDVQVSIDEDDCTEVGADMILEGGPYGCYDNYLLERTPAVSGCPDPTVDGKVYVNCSDIGKTITMRVTDPRTGSACWGKVRVEDKLKPEITCPDIIINCADDLVYGQNVTRLAKADAQGPLSFEGTTDFNMDINAPNNATVVDVNLTLRIEHEDATDLDVSLISPMGTEIDLFTDPCAPGNNNVEVTLDDEAQPFFCSGIDLTLVGRMQPENDPLSTVDGESAAGTWVLRVADDTNGDPTNFQFAILDVKWNGFYEEASATDNCNVVSVTYVSDQDNGNCSTSGNILRQWKAVDQSGNERTCTQNITVRRNGLMDIEFPEDYDGIENPVLDCSSPYPDTFADVCIKNIVAVPVGAAIPDGATKQQAEAAGAVLALPNGQSNQLIKDIDFKVELTHPNISHTKIYIQRLDALGNVAKEVKLFDMNFNLGYVKCSGSPLRDLDIHFDDEGCAMPHEPCVDYAPTILGRFVPMQELALFDGDPVGAGAGLSANWRLVVQDSVQDLNPPTQTILSVAVEYLYTDDQAITTPTVGGSYFYNGGKCEMTRSFTDEVVDVCPTSYKILRHWTVIDWCTGERRTHTQLIKVLDTCAPIVSAPRSDDTDDRAVEVPVYTPANAHAVHGTCVGHLDIPALEVCYENCSGVEGWSTKLYSVDGAVLIGEIDGNGGTFRDIALDLDDGAQDLGDLEPDALYLVRYAVWDNCNNKVEIDVYIRVVDRVPPTPICREVTQLALTGDLGDTTTLCANTLDEGSYDNCGDVHFFLREMVMGAFPEDLDPIGGPFGDATLNFEILGDSRPGGCDPFDLALDYKFKSCIGFDCDDAGEDNQVFLLVVDDYVVNYIDDYLNNTLPIFDALLNYNCFPLVILPKDKLDNEPAFDQLNGGQRYWEFYLSTADFLPTAIIWEGHYNFCMVEVLVEDKVRPVCVAPEDVWTTCVEIPANVDLSDTAVLQQLFGNATSWDNCFSYTEERNPNVDVDLCGVGSVTRNWYAYDNSDNRSIGTCRQTIMIMKVNSYEIDIPGDFEDECTTVSPDSLVYREFGCDLIGVNVEEQEFPASANGECKKIFRTYKVINWCEYDGFSPATVIPRIDRNRDGVVGDGFTPSNPGSKFRANYPLISNGDFVYIDALIDPTNRYLPSTGYYSYEQHIKIYDDTAPELRDTLSGPFCGGELDEDPCTGEVDLLPFINETCTDVTISWDLDAFADGTFDLSGDDNLTGRFPLGSHSVRFYVADDCGNTSQIDIPFDIIDCKHPTPVCYNGLSMDLMASGMVELWASDFDASSFDYCHDIEFRINRIEDVNGDGFITPDDYVTTPPTTDSIVARCKDLGILYVQLWVHELSGDGVNDWDYCVTFVEVQDNLDACSGSKAALGGKIANEDNEAVEHVTVELNTGDAATTTNDGEYAFAVTKGGDYTITPSRDDNPLNGVSTFDLVLISKHILNVKKLDSAYKVIAADANNSQSVTTLDLVALRKLILRVSNELPNNTSWRFVDKSHNFVNIQAPWNFPEVKNFNNVTADQLNADFVAVKVGDVNGDATPNSLLGVDNRTFNGNLVFSADQQTVRAGEEFTVEFSADQNVLGYQFTLDFDEKAVELVDIVDGIALEAKNFNVLDGQIATSWNDDQQIAGSTMFSLVFRAKSDVEVASVLSISSAITASEAYSLSGDLMGVALDFGGLTATADFGLYQNTPNPFKGETTIGFNLPEASTATLTISDVNGKVIRVIEGDYAKGYNTVVLSRSDIGVATGVLSYQLETTTHSATKQMIVIE